MARTMGGTFDPNRPELVDLCRRFGVRRLDLFGSAASGGFDAARSDVDFVVEFDDDQAHLFDRYFGLKEALEALYGRPVDLVSEGASANPCFVASLNRTRRRIYASEGA
jgi:hypothetical protein